MKKILIILSFVLSVTFASNAYCLNLTFEGTVNGSYIIINATGDVLGDNNILWQGSAGTIWNHEWEISETSQWSLLNELQPENYIPNENSYGQMAASSIMNIDSLGFRYHEFLSGYYPSIQERWSHEIDIKHAISGAFTLEDMVGIVDAFSYREHVSYATSYLSDGSTDPIWDIERVEGFLTLVGFDLEGNTSSSGGNALPSTDPAPVPEPSTLLLLVSGLMGLGLYSRRKKG